MIPNFSVDVFLFPLPSPSPPFPKTFYSGSWKFIAPIPHLHLDPLDPYDPHDFLTLMRNSQSMLHQPDCLYEPS